MQKKIAKIDSRVVKELQKIIKIYERFTTFA